MKPKVKTPLTRIRDTKIFFKYVFRQFYSLFFVFARLQTAFLWEAVWETGDIEVSVVNIAYPIAAVIQANRYGNSQGLSVLSTVSAHPFLCRDWQFRIDWNGVQAVLWVFTRFLLRPHAFSCTAIKFAANGEIGPISIKKLLVLPLKTQIF